MVFSWRIETVQSVASTQGIVKERAATGAPQGLVVQALEQTGGKGRHGRAWISPKGNLYISVLLRPSCIAPQAAQLSFVAALAVSDAIDSYISSTALRMLKWPNDILLDGRKCAGILLETEVKGSEAVWTALGIGVNIASAPEGIGTALGDYTQKEIELSAFRDALLSCLAARLASWETEGFKKIRQSWLAMAHKPGTKLQIKLGETVQEGYFHDMDDSGNLLLKGADSKMTALSAGDVFIR